MEPTTLKNEEESLAIIRDMISKAKQDVSDNSFLYLLWGWLVFIASLAQYLMVAVWPSDWNNWPWAILMPLGGIISTVYGIRKNKNQKVRSYSEEMMGKASIAFGVCLFIVLFFLPQFSNWNVAEPMIIMVYGMWIFVSGSIMRFKPLIWGGIADWALSIACFYVTGYAVLLMLSAAVLVGYIIPGHLLRIHYKRQQR